MKEDRVQLVYEALIGLRPYSYDGEQIENLFETGKPCDQLYESVYAAKVALMERLGEDDEDEQLECIIQDLLEIGRIQAYAMFRYGQKLGR